MGVARIRSGFRETMRRSPIWVNSSAQIAALSNAVRWLLRDDFNDTLTAGNVNGTSATPGPGTRTVTDTDSKLSLSGGSLNLDSHTTPANGDPGIWYGVISRQAGQLVIGDLKVDSGARLGIGFDDSGKSGALADAYMRLGVSSTVEVNTGSLIAAGTFAAGTAYKCAVILRALGAFYYIKGGAFTNWTLLFIDSTRATASISPAFVTGTVALTSTNSFIRVPSNLWLPTPLASDGFGGNNADTDGLGHAEGVNTGLGSGGVITNGWTGGGVWRTAVDGITITPTEGAEALINAGFEGTYVDESSGGGGTVNVAPDWDNLNAETDGSDTLDEETSNVYSGSSAQLVTVDGAGEGVQTTALPFSSHVWHLVTAWIYPTSGTVQVTDSSGLFPNASTTGTGAYEQVKFVKRATSNRKLLVRSFPGAANFIVDDASVKQLTLSTLFSNTFTAASDLTIQADLASDPDKTQAGIVLNLDDADTPANFVIAYHDGTNAVLDKCVAGAYTNLISASTAFVADATIQVIKAGTQYTLKYNGAQVGTTQTVSDAGIISNTLHGAFSTDSGNTIDGLTATGTWANSSGKATNTPTTGAEILTDGPLEDWTSATDLTSWTEFIGGSSTVNQETTEVNGGSNSARLDIDGSNSIAQISQTPTSVIGTWYRLSAYAKASSGTPSIALNIINDAVKIISTSWVQYKTTTRATATNHAYVLKRNSAASLSLYFDDAEAVPLTLSTLFKSLSAATDDVIATVDLVASPANTQAGLVINLDSAASPANFMIAYHDGTNAVLDKCVAGTYTNVISAAATFSANAELRVVKDGTAVRLYYNNAQVGTGTVSDAGIISNTLHGLFSTDSGNELNNFVLYARGTDGEYAVLDRFIRE